ncbi:MAG: response regulator, partial [Saprospiraceae bacterium]|nr:response regulator [Saprospiraceae bacterium]
MIETLVIDDEKLARTLLANYIEKVPQLKLIAECKDAIQASEILQKRKIDLIFLDIQMPELTGIEFLNTLQDPPLVIFTTAYPDYALKGFELDAVDYLLKPFRFDRFLQAVNKAVRRITLPRHGNSDNEYILIKSDYKIFKVLFDDIDFIEGMREYVAYHLTDRKLLAY